MQTKQAKKNTNRVDNLDIVNIDADTDADRAYKT